ncbi:MAG: hypothetical protein AAGE01_01700 [Pseudomonadota bacterium]
MTNISLSRLPKTLTLLATVALLQAGSASADGAIGEHVNDLQGHLDEYAEEVVWLIEQVDGIVDSYESDGLAAAKPEAVVDHWEAVEFHSAIETNYIPLYASIWQGLFGVRQAVEREASIAEVRAEQEKLEQVLWQSLGAVKVAAQYQQQGLLPEIAATEAATPIETLRIVKRELDRVVAKYAERLGDEATTIIQETYLSRFEGVEGMLIEEDADLVEELEIDFNVTLPKAIEADPGVDDVRKVVVAMQGKLDRAIALLEDAENNAKDVF